MNELKSSKERIYMCIRVLEDGERERATHFRVVDAGAYEELEERLAIASAERDHLQREMNSLGDETGPEPMPDMAHLDAVQLRRIIDRHVRWRNDALRLLEQVNNGYEGEWPEIAEFISRTTTRPVLAMKTSPPHAYTCTECFTDAGQPHRPGCRFIEIDARAVSESAEPK